MLPPEVWDLIMDWLPRSDECALGGASGHLWAILCARPHWKKDAMRLYGFTTTAADHFAPNTVTCRIAVTRRCGRARALELWDAPDAEVAALCPLASHWGGRKTRKVLPWRRRSWVEPPEGTRCGPRTCWKYALAVMVWRKRPRHMRPRRCEERDLERLEVARRDFSWERVALARMVRYAGGEAAIRRRRADDDAQREFFKGATP